MGDSKGSIAVRALAYISCHGNKGCMAKKVKAAKCKLASFNLKAAQEIAKNFQEAAKKKNVKKMSAASGKFKKIMASISQCNITPTGMKAAFTRGFLIKGGKKLLIQLKLLIKKS